MKIVRLKNKNFGTQELSQTITGWALYEEGKGFYAFSSHRDKYGILSPYIPSGGRKALESIVKSGGFVNLDGIEFVNPIN